MDKVHTDELSCAQVHDLLVEMLAGGRAPPLALLLAQEPPAPQSGELPFDGASLVMAPREIAHEIARTDKLIARFPGLIDGFRATETAKYRAPWPPEDALLPELVGRYLLHIRGVWSQAVLGGRKPELQFAEFVREYVDGRTLGGIYRLDGRYGLALQLIRLACGLPRFPATMEARR